MKRSRTKLTAFVLGTAFAASLGGCPGITNDTTIQELVDAAGVGNVTVGDVLGAIEQFTGHSVALPLGASLTDDQQAQIAALQERFDSGQIDGQEYLTQAADAIGLEAAGRPFGAGPGRHFGARGFRGGPIGMGGPMGMGGGPGGMGNMRGGPLRGLDAALNLGADQETQAQSIFDAMRTDIIALQVDAKAKIDALLTADQLAILDSFDSGAVHGFRYFHGGMRGSVLAADLGLTQDQQTQINAIVDALKTAVEARRQQAQTEFRAILTADQQAKFDELVAAHETQRRALTEDASES